MSTGNGASTAESTVERLERQRAERKETREKARVEQYARDLEAINALELEHGYELDITLRVPTFTPGLPSVVGVRTPSDAEYKRFFQQVNRGGNADAKMAAHKLLAEVCWVYPVEKETRDAMISATPGLLASVGNRAVKLGEMEAETEGKG